MFTESYFLKNVKIGKFNNFRVSGGGIIAFKRGGNVTSIFRTEISEIIKIFKLGNLCSFCFLYYCHFYLLLLIIIYYLNMVAQPYNFTKLDKLVKD